MQNKGPQIHRGFVPTYERLNNAALSVYARQWPNARGLIGNLYNANDIQRLLNHICCLDREGDYMLNIIQGIASMPANLPPGISDDERKAVLQIAGHCAKALQALIDAGAIVPTDVSDATQPKEPN